MKPIHLFSLFILIAATACTTQRVATNYLQSVTDTTIKALPAVPEPVIQKNDLLSIKVFSLSTDPQTDIPYNLPDATAAGGGATSGFLVDSKGDIEFPRIGSLHVEGMTKSGLAETIRQKLSTSLKQPSVMVRFLNYRVTVLGEVGAQGSYNVPTERVTILEAVGLAGGVTEFGNMKSIKVLRETAGQREVGNIDLTSKQLFNSPYYNLQQNDVVLVEQNERRAKTIRQQEQQVVAQQISLGISILTAVALVFNFFK